MVSDAINNVLVHHDCDATDPSKYLQTSTQDSESDSSEEEPQQQLSGKL